MELKTKKLVAIKFGVSEHKRSNYLNFYFSAANAFLNLIGVKKNETEKIYNQFLSCGVYERKKENKKISRELAFFKNKFPLYYLNDNDEIEITNLAKKILENPNEKIFNGKTYLENALILYLIKQYPEENIKNNPFFCAIDFAKEEKYNRKEFISKIFKLKSEEIKEFIKEIKEKIKIKSLLDKYFKFLSGIPNVKKDNQIKKFQNKRDELIKILIENILFKESDEKLILDKLYEFINEYKELRNLKKIKNFTKAYKKIFKLNEKDLSKFILDYESKNKEKYFNLIKNIDINYLLENFYFVNKKGEYESLIQKYLFQTDFFLNKKNKIHINPKHIQYINDLEENYNEILKIKLDDENIIKKFENLDIKNNNKNKDISIREIINEYYDEQFYNDFFEIISLSDEKNINQKLIKLGYENEHINGILDAPTIFEFVINLFFFKLFYKEDILNINEISDEELTNNFKESINTYLTTNLIPQRFASGNRSDAIFKKQKILIEPTLQIKRQVKHELNSITDHLKKIGYNSSILVAPKISKDFLPQVISYKHYDNYSWIILPFNVNMLIKIKNSNYSKELFYKIKNDFENCETYKDVNITFQKYNH